MTSYFKNTNKDFTITEEAEEIYRSNNICRFCEKEIFSDKVGDHCQLTGKYRVLAHNKCNINVTQKQSSFVSFVFHYFITSDSHIFFKKLVDKKNEKVKSYFIPKTNVEYMSVTYGFIRFNDSYRFLSSSSDSLVKTLIDNNHKNSKIWEKQLLVMIIY